MSTPLSKFELERLAAGDLDDQTTRDFMARLRAEPDGIKRLEALRRDNVRFLNDHPPELMLAAIRARFEKESAPPPPSAPPLAPPDMHATLPQRPEPMRRRLMLAAALFLLAACAALLMTQRSSHAPASSSADAAPIADAPSPHTAASVAASTKSTTDSDLAALILSPGQRHFLERQDQILRIRINDEDIARAGPFGPDDALQVEAIREGKTSIEIFYADTTTEGLSLEVRVPSDGPLKPYEVALVPGETHHIATAGVVRVATQDSSVIAVTLHDDTLALKALMPGRTWVHFTTQDALPPHTFRVFVGEPLEDPRLPELLESRRAALNACASTTSGGRADLVALITPEGYVDHAFAEEYSLPDPTLGCILDLIKRWNFAPHTLDHQGLLRFSLDL